MRGFGLRAAAGGYAGGITATVKPAGVAKPVDRLLYFNRSINCDAVAPVG